MRSRVFKGAEFENGRFWTQTTTSVFSGLNLLRGNPNPANSRGLIFCKYRLPLLTGKCMCNKHPYKHAFIECSDLLYCAIIMKKSTSSMADDGAFPKD